MATRYIAEWIAKQHFDSQGEWQPDMDERECKELRTRDAAMRHAAKHGDKYGWARVAEESRRSMSDDLGSFSLWDEVRSWTWAPWGWIENRG